MKGANITRHRPMTRRQRRRGATLIEFAFISTSLMLLTLGLVQFAIIANASLSLSQAAREGARYAAVNPYDDAKIKYYVQTHVPSSLNYTHLTIAVTPAQGSVDRAPRLPITVSISYDMKRKLFLPTDFFGVKFYSKVKTVSATYMIE